MGVHGVDSQSVIQLIRGRVDNFRVVTNHIASIVVLTVVHTLPHSIHSPVQDPQLGVRWTFVAFYSSMPAMRVCKH